MGYGDISGTNSTEKGITILYQVVGVVFFSLISSFLASIIQNFDDLEQEE